MDCFYNFYFKSFLIQSILVRLDQKFEFLGEAYFSFECLYFNQLIFPLQKSKSTKQQVVLTNLSLASGGTYKCEVSAEAPSFRTKFAKQDMVVVVLPSKAEIVGIQPKYQVGDLVNVTCFSYK